MVVVDSVLLALVLVNQLAFDSLQPMGFVEVSPYSDGRDVVVTEVVGHDVVVVANVVVVGDVEAAC